MMNGVGLMGVRGPGCRLFWYGVFFFSLQSSLHNSFHDPCLSKAGANYHG